MKFKPRAMPQAVLSKNSKRSDLGGSFLRDSIQETRRSNAEDGAHRRKSLLQGDKTLNFSMFEIEAANDSFSTERLLPYHNFYPTMDKKCRARPNDTV
jgi:hypothetical protein